MLQIVLYADAKALLISGLLHGSVITLLAARDIPAPGERQDFE
jgi:hypothetical protein